MAAPRISLASFLRTARATLHSAIQHPKPVTFVIGNQSADIDSICSAIAYAYVRTYTSVPPTVHVPIANIPAEDIRIRSELDPVFARAGIDAADVITLSDLPPATARATELPPDRTTWLLVDHNSLEGPLGQLYGERVVGCIDHHAEEGKVAADTGAEPRVVEKSGSCASLIVEQCKGAWEALEHDSVDAKRYDAEWAALALGPVLIDTINLKDEHKVTEHDTAAAEFLVNVIKASSLTLAEFEKDSYYEDIDRAKTSIDKLSLSEVLRKDYKQWTEGPAGLTLGICSSVGDMRCLLAKAGSEDAFWGEVRAFAEDERRRLSLCAVMTAFAHEGAFCRELLLVALDGAGARAAEAFERESGGELGLQPWEGGRLDKTEDQSGWRRCWVQKSLKDSRKQVAPLMRKAML